MVNYLIASNIIFFLATIFSGGFTLSNLLRWGAKFGPLIANGEWQRLLICIFLHGNLWHLFFNLYALYYLGRMAEEIYGYRKFFGIYIVSGLSGSILSYLLNYSQIGVGASGAIFGLAGAIFASGLKYRHTSLHQVGMNLLPFILINLLIGAFSPAIDNAAHLGGVLSGMLLGWIVSPGASWIRWKRTLEEVLYWVTIAFVVFAMLTFFVPNLASGKASIDKIVTFHNEAQKILLKIELGFPPSPLEVEKLSPPDRKAREIKELLLTFLEEGGKNSVLQREIEEKFLSWREEILDKYQGIILEKSP
ncbi:MAG: rhomboid family intramembrane serine protease [Atribacterota bacterium]|jgi:rhomboid protease GluP|nr:rhomboid family intramembrane serine protease [Atribacterota bacterium]